MSPKNLKTGISSTVILSCAVQGSPHFTVYWFRNTEPILPDQHFSIQGTNNETLFITAAQKRHSGAYQCFATRKGQTAQDFSIILLEGELQWCYRKENREDVFGVIFRLYLHKYDPKHSKNISQNPHQR